MQNSPNTSTGAAAALLLLQRREARRSFASWARLNGFEPAAHHLLFIRMFEAVARKEKRRVIILVPPGSAKSTYLSVLGPPWFLGQRPGANILACSYAYTLAERFGKRCRNIIEEHQNILGYGLSRHSQAAGDWETTTGGIYFCAGVGAGIAGHRADLGLIDDYLGSQEEADSKVIRDKQWDWFWNDFWPRLKPDASILIIANRRHEDDLIGRLLLKEAHKWEVIRLPFFAEDGDPLGRPAHNGKYAPESRLWPEWFTADQAKDVAELPSRILSGLYQQNPTPEEGDYFKREWLQSYTRDELDTLLARRPQIYGAADFAVSELLGANRTCLGGGALDEKGRLYVLPDIFWKVSGPKEMLANFIAFLKRRSPSVVWAEKGHITKSLGPFLREQMVAEGIYTYIEEVTPVKAKDVRARSIQGRCSLGHVLFPKFASWWPEAEHELLTFPGGRTDDFVDFLSHLGMGINNMIRTEVESQEQEVLPPVTLTLRSIREADRERRAALEELYGGR